MAVDLDLCYLSAVEAVERFKTRSLSPVELVSALIERIEAVELKVNAFTYTFFERALEQAREAERPLRRARPGSEVGRFGGRHQGLSRSQR